MRKLQEIPQIGMLHGNKHVVKYEFAEMDNSARGKRNNEDVPRRHISVRHI
jgi:hypothetical protein